MYALLFDGVCCETGNEFAIEGRHRLCHERVEFGNDPTAKLMGNSSYVCAPLCLALDLKVFISPAEVTTLRCIIESVFANQCTCIHMHAFVT